MARRSFRTVHLCPCVLLFRSAYSKYFSPSSAGITHPRDGVARPSGFGFLHKEGIKQLGNQYFGCESAFRQVRLVLLGRFCGFTRGGFGGSSSIWFGKRVGTAGSLDRRSQHAAGNRCRAEAFLHGLPLESNGVALVQLCGPHVLDSGKRCAPGTR